MKKILNSLFCIIFLFSIHAFAYEEIPEPETIDEQVGGGVEDMGGSDTPITRPIPRPPGHGTAQAQGQGQQQTQNCEQAKNSIDNMCKNHPGLLEAQEKTGLFSRMMSGLTSGGAGQSALNAQAEGTAQLSGVNQAKADCEKTYQACYNQCHAESSAAQARNDVAAVNKANANSQYCQANHKEAVSKQGLSAGQITNLLAAAAMILSKLGLGGSDDGSNLKPQEDPLADDNMDCSGPNASLLVACQKKIAESGIKGGAGGLNSSTGVGGLGAVDPVGMLNTAGTGEPGGTSKGGAKAAGAGSGRGFGGAMMPFGGAGFGASGGAGSEAAGSGQDPNINKGYIGAGGGDGGGSGSGSGGGNRLAGAGFEGGPSSGSTNNAELNREIGKIAAKAGDKRGLASTDGKAGPMQSIWEEVGKAYKKTANTMIGPQ